MNTIFAIHLCSTFYLVGLIWMVQVVHYELMDRVGEDGFARYEADHGRLITPIVAPPMIIELATGVLLAMGYAPAWLPRWVAIAGLVAIGGIWLSTFLLQVPFHAVLMNGFNLDAYRGLVTTNWIRTALWTLRGGVLGYYLACALR
jgi:uncharacterized membrane protein